MRRYRARAPGRINVIGEHVDYAGGTVLPATIAQATTAVAGVPSSRSDPTGGPPPLMTHIVVSCGSHGECQFTLPQIARAACDGDLPTESLASWAPLAIGCVAVALESVLGDLSAHATASDVVATGPRVVWALHVAGNVPLGAGLSSSASFCVATIAALQLAIAGPRGAAAAIEPLPNPVSDASPLPKSMLPPPFGTLGVSPTTGRAVGDSSTGAISTSVASVAGDDSTSVASRHDAVGAHVGDGVGVDPAMPRGTLGVARKTAVALAAQRVEHQFAKVKCGIMDQFASAHGRDGECLQLDCATLQLTPHRLAPLLVGPEYRRDHSGAAEEEATIQEPPAAGLLLINSMAKHSLADGQYNVIRADLEAATGAVREHVAATGGDRGDGPWAPAAYALRHKDDAFEQLEKDYGDAVFGGQPPEKKAPDADGKGDGATASDKKEVTVVAPGDEASSAKDKKAHTTTKDEVPAKWRQFLRLQFVVGEIARVAAFTGLLSDAAAACDAAVAADAPTRHVAHALGLTGSGAKHEARLAKAGALLNATHQGLSASYGVSTPELDFIQDWLLQQCGCPDLVAKGKGKGVWCYGARMMGGGFGGCVLALVRPMTYDRSVTCEAALAASGLVDAFAAKFPTANGKAGCVIYPAVLGPGLTADALEAPKQ